MEKLSVPISIVVAGLFIAGGIYFSGRSSSPSNTAGANPDNVASAEITLREVSSSDHILGNPNADIIIVEYSDPECPFCKTFHSTMQRIMSDYGDSGKVAWVYRHFPIDQLHSKARKEAEALECAFDLGGNNAFWKYTDRLYEITPSNDGLADAELYNIAEFTGLDSDDFSQCLDSGQTAEKVEADYQDAIASGGRGTPHSIIINTKTDEKTPILGAQPYASVKATIDSILK